MKKSRIWIITGIILLFGAFGLTIHNYYEDYQAKNNAADAVQKLAYVMKRENTGLLYKMNPDIEMPTKTINGIKYIGVLEVPKLSLQLPVMSHWSPDGLKIAPGRYKGSVYKRNIIIAGHNYRSHFSRLKTLDIGSKIWFIDLEGNRFEYKVSDIEIIKGTDVKQMEKGKWDMTLFTCTYGGQNRMALRCTITNMLAGGN